MHGRDSSLRRRLRSGGGSCQGQLPTQRSSFPDGSIALA